MKGCLGAPCNDSIVAVMTPSMLVLHQSIISSLTLAASLEVGCAGALALFVPVVAKTVFVQGNQVGGAVARGAA